MSGTAGESSPDVAIAVPHTGSVSMRWAIRLSELQMPPHTIVAKRTAAIDLAREQTVEDALVSDPEWILFMDSDVVPPADVFQRLTRHGQKIVSGLYHMDNPDGVHPAMWRLDEYDAPTIMEKEREGLVNVDAVGFGCLLVHRDVIEDIERPWFRWTKGYDNHPWDLQHLGEKPGVSEDFFFCHKAQQAGYDIYVDTTTKCIHGKTCYLSDEGTFMQSQLNPEHMNDDR
jgi:hypothetical protein